MAQFRAEFWEVPLDASHLDNIPAEKALWFETEQDRQRRHALQSFFQQVLPTVTELIDSELTQRQREVVDLYYFQGRTQEDIAATLNLSQSTVSRHLFGTVRNGRKVGGAIPKLQRAVETLSCGRINRALADLQASFAQSR